LGWQGGDDDRGEHEVERVLGRAECGHGPDGVRKLRFRADGIDVLKYASRGTGVDDALFHRDKFIGGATKFLLGESEAAEYGRMVVKEGASVGEVWFVPETT
jgi:hypothetical protein